MSAFQKPTRRQFLKMAGVSAGATTVLARTADSRFRRGSGEARLAERPHPHRPPRRGGHGPGRHRDRAEGPWGRARGRGRHLRRPLRGVPEEVRQGPPGDSRLPGDPGPQGRGRGDRGQPRPLAHADDDRRAPGRQGRLLREADDALDRRGHPHGGGREEDGAHPPGRQPVRELDRLREGPATLRRGRHRPGQPRRGLDEPQLGDRRSPLADPEGRLAADDRLGPRFLGSAPRRPFEPTRLFRWRLYDDYGTSITGDLFVHLFSGMHLVTGRLRALARLLLGRPALLEGRPRDPGRPGRRLRLPGPGHEPGLQPDAQGQLRGRRGDERVGGDGLPLRRERGPHGAGRRRGHGLEAAASREGLGRRARERGVARRGDAAALRRPPGLRRPPRPLPELLRLRRSRKPVVEDALYGLRAAAPSLLCNLSYDKGRPVGWDPESFKFTVG